jgi:hypothetical protein
MVLILPFEHVCDNSSSTASVRIFPLPGPGPRIPQGCSRIPVVFCSPIRTLRELGAEEDGTAVRECSGRLSKVREQDSPLGHSRALVGQSQ